MTRELYLLLATAVVLSVGCAGSANDRSADVTGAPTAPGTTLPHPDSIAGFDWKVGDVCTYQYQYGSRKSVHTQTLSKISAGRITFSDRGDDGSGGSIVLESGGAQLKQWVSQANGEQLESVPALDWMTFPLLPNQVWSVQSAMSRPDFSGRHEFDIQRREPGNRYRCPPVSLSLSGSPSRSRTSWSTTKGSGIQAPAPGATGSQRAINCLVKHEYQDSFGDNSSRQLLTYKKK